jgi:ribosome-associated protein
MAKTTSAAKTSVATVKRLERQGVLDVLRACEAKKAADVTVLELEKGSSAFTDYFVICSGSNPRQIQAISDEVEERLAKAGLRPQHVEGYQQAEWVLLDYVDFVVHIFSEAARKFYDLERLWKSAKRLDAAALEQSGGTTAAPTKRAAGARSGAVKPSKAPRKGSRATRTASSDGHGRVGRSRPRTH